MTRRLFAAFAAAAITASLAGTASAGVIARGTLVSVNNEPAAGTVSVVKLASGARRLQISRSAIGPGPALHIYLVAGTVRKNADVNRFKDLGALKATTGAQSYTIPRGVDIRRYRTVVVWCADFSVIFGTAPLRLT